MIKDSVVICYVHENEVSESFHRCMMRLLKHEASNYSQVEPYAIRCYGGDALPEARNKGVEQFLNSEGEWLLWVDSDMGFEPNALDELLMVADRKERPVVGGLCFAYREVTPDSMAGWVMDISPTIFDWRTEGEKQGFVARHGYPINALVRVAGTGSAFILVHRDVFERINEIKGGSWYNRNVNPATKTLISEDLSFCMRVNAVGYPVHVYTGVKTTHHKQTWIGEQDYWNSRVAPYQTDEVDIIVPIGKDRHHSKRFMQSLRSTTGLARVYAVCDASDHENIRFWRDARANVLMRPNEENNRMGSFAEKVNFAYPKTDADWIFLVGDDVVFRPGWLDHAIAVAGEDFDVVGTNDLATKRVVDGEHASHMLIRRSYVDKVGAGWDGPGIVCHEGYRHCFVDDEIVQAAKVRGKWAMALGSVVEHMHPVVGKAPSDDLYLKGQRSFKRDEKHFVERFTKYVIGEEVANS